MQTLKLQVGKTYRNRKGEEVKIVRKIDSTWPFVGDNEESYNEQGRYYSANWASPYDLIEELSETRHSFDIPDGVKKVTVEQVGNRIVVDMVPKEDEGPKPGDVMINTHGSVYIFKDGDGDKHNFYAWLGESGRLSISGVCEPGRPATPEEAQPLWDALKKAGKMWNPEEMQVERVTEWDRILEWVEMNIKDGYYNQEDVATMIGDYLEYKTGKNLFVI